MCKNLHDESRRARNARCHIGKNSLSFKDPNFFSDPDSCSTTDCGRDPDKDALWDDVPFGMHLVPENEARKLRGDRGVKLTRKYCASLYKKERDQ